MKVVFKNCAPFTDCISEINNTQIDHAKDIDIVMPMYNIEIIIQKHEKVSGNTIEMNQFWLLLLFLVIFLVILICSNINKK